MKVGDKVVAIRSTWGNIISKGTIYIISDIDKCPCGNTVYNVVVQNGSSEVLCSKCNIHFFDSNMYFDASIFAPISYNSAHDELINKEIVKETTDIPIVEPLK